MAQKNASLGKGLGAIFPDLLIMISAKSIRPQLRN